MSTIEIVEPVIIKIGAIADKYQTDVFVVGGYVRDFLLGKERTDFDFSVIGDPLEFSKIVAKEFNSKAVIFPKFRTAMVPIGDKQIEFVGTRKEEYSPDSRNPITIEGTLEDDLKRRDFTINALAICINQNSKKYQYGAIIDLFGGIRALSQELLITPLDPITTYSDDPLRMMRAARFATQLNFKVDQSSIDAITQMADRITIVSKERIADEFLKIINSNKPSIGIHILFKTNLLQYILPELWETAGVDQNENEKGEIIKHKDVFHHSLKVLDNIATHTDNTSLRLAALFHDIAKPKTKRYNEENGWSFHNHQEIGTKMVDWIFKNMKLPLDNLDYIKKLISMHHRPMQLVDGGVSDSAIRRLAANAGDTLEDLFLLCRCDITSKNDNIIKRYLNNYDIVVQKVIDVQIKDKLREFKSPVNGDEIMELCNIKPSKMVGYIKTNIENAILDGVIPNEHTAAKEFLLDNKDEWLKVNI